jgi:hypothetical protein
MKFAAALFALLVSTQAGAAQLQISVYEKLTNTTTAFAFDTSSRKMRELSEAKGEDLPQLSKYSVVKEQLRAGPLGYMDATEVLYQCQIEGLDIVVLRDEYNSISNPLRLLAALVGHPIQVSQIIFVAIADGEVVFEKRLAREPASYRWKAEVLQ